MAEVLATTPQYFATRLY